GGIRGEAGAVGAEAGAGDLLGGGLDGGLDLVLVALPQRAGPPSTLRASSIIGSCEASTAAAPPSHRRRRSAGSASREPSTSRAASVSGESLVSSARTIGASGPSHSRMRSSPKESVSFSRAGYTGTGAVVRCARRESAVSRYSRRRLVLGLVRSAAARNSVRA